MTTSFSQETKDILTQIEIRGKCCKKAFENGKNLFDKNTLEESMKHFKCESCRSCFLRGIFITFGSVTNPVSGYHLELSFKNADQRDIVFEYLLGIFADAEILLKLTERKLKYIIYYKNSAAIEDFLAYIGANKAAFDIMNSKILKDLRNSTNRIVNCETANIDKSVAASRKQVEIIRELKAVGEFSKLVPELQHTGELRLEYEEASLTELGLKMEPPISKSGVNHRLRKITEHYEEYLAGRGK